MTPEELIEYAERLLTAFDRAASSLIRISTAMERSARAHRELLVAWERIQIDALTPADLERLAAALDDDHGRHAAEWLRQRAAAIRGERPAEPEGEATEVTP